VLAAGFSSIEMADARCAATVVAVDRKAVAAVDRLICTTPSPQRTLVSGTLDTIRHSDGMFTLLMDGGKAVKGIADGVAAGQLAQLFGQQVVVAGTAVFRPSGALLRVEAAAIDPADPGEAIWGKVPRPLFSGQDSSALRQPQGMRSGVNATIGQWPGEESDEEIVAALRELS
jgi:hypothetical protein